MQLLHNLLLSDAADRLKGPNQRLPRVPAETFVVVCSRCGKKSKLFLNMQVNGNGCEDSPSRYPVLSARTPGVTPTTAPYTLPGTPTLIEEHSVVKSES